MTDRLAKIFLENLKKSRLKTQSIFLRDYRILPCAGCECCAKYPFTCPYDSKDETHFLYKKLFSASMVIFASPIFFYGLPGHFKSFIDRSQCYWNKRQAGVWRPEQRLALSILAGARKNGEKLFSGSLRTMRWFGQPLNLRFTKPALFRGLDKPQSVFLNPQIAEQLTEKAKLCADILKR